MPLVVGFSLCRTRSRSNFINLSTEADGGEKETQMFSQAPSPVRKVITFRTSDLSEKPMESLPRNHSHEAIRLLNVSKSEVLFTYLSDQPSSFKWIPDPAVRFGNISPFQVPLGPLRWRYPVASSMQHPSHVAMLPSS